MTEKSNETLNESENDKEQDTGGGIPSLGQARKAPSGKKKGLLLLTAVLLIGASVAVSVIGHKKKENSAQEQQKVSLTSSRTLTLPPLNTVRIPAPPPVKEPPVVPEPEAAPAPEPQPVFAPPPEVKVSAAAPLVPENKPKEPTLDERRFQSPMMGEDAAIRSSEEIGGKGLSQTLREEGYGSNSSNKLGGLLASTSTPNGKASLMPDRNLLLSKGTFIDCILETKLDTTVPGMTRCVIPRNVYSANGKVLLLERGSKVIGEYKGAVENGLNRIFVLWTQIQTPKGVKVTIDSPGADSLGGSGLAGDIDYHWWARFGNALLFTLVQDGFEFAMTKQSENNGGVNYYQNSEDCMKEIIREAMRQSGNIPPTLTKNQGERIGIFVARDVDFSSVYRLKPIQ